jgi:hypothetical protein
MDTASSLIFPPVSRRGHRVASWIFSAERKGGNELEAGSVPGFVIELIWAF